MSSLKSVEIDVEVATKIEVAAKKLGVDVKSLVVSILNEWLKNNRKLVVTVDDILYEYEKSLRGYSESTKKTKLKIIKSFLEWCEAGKVEPSEEVLEKYLTSVGAHYSQSYVSHARSSLKDFVQWYRIELN